MVQARFAFTAQYWGKGEAVVCRAVEDRPGPVVEQQFGEFPTWTQALGCANKLNAGLDLDPLEVRRIVTSSLLATACVLQESLNCRGLWNNVQVATRAAHLRFVMPEVALALTFCRAASSLSDISAHRVFLSAQNAVEHASRFLGAYDGDDRDLEQLASRTRALNAAIPPLASSFQPSFSSNDECWPRDLYRSEKLKRQAILRHHDSLALLSKRLSNPFLTALNSQPCGIHSSTLVSFANH